MNENDARTLIERFAKKQQDGHFACPRCGEMTMDTESVTRNALSRRVPVYVCDTCGTQEAIEDMMASHTPLTAWAIAAAPENWSMKERDDGCEERHTVPKLRLEYLGHDRWRYPVYECNGRLYVDIQPHRNMPAKICTKYRNAYDGEACDPVPEGTIIEFVPERDTWPF